MMQYINCAVYKLCSQGYKVQTVKLTL